MPNTFFEKIRSIRIKIKLLLDNGIYYINSPQVLPPPLSRKDEDALIEKLREGDTTARDKLVEHNLRLVVYIAKKFENSGVNIEDLISIGTIGLIKAVNTFKADKNIKLATYASRCIENEILMYLRKINQQRLDISLDEPLNVDWDGNELLLSDVLGSDGLEINDNVEQEDEKRILHMCMEGLSPRERLIMSMRFGMDGKREHTQKEVADILGISQSYISRLEKRIILKLKRDIERQTIEK
ncbi:MAG: RNA polymerase sporulation sigma factor SigE [Clostridia bacterium]|nr:RNA polymerase sporulation sigma factor SigE [Clostridia bacterium]